MDNLIIELLLAEKSKIEERLKEVNKSLENVGYKDPNSVNKDNLVRFTNITDEHIAKSSLKNQIITVLKAKGRFLHNSEIAEDLKIYHKGLDMVKLKRKIAVELGIMKKSGNNVISHQYSKSMHDFVWGNKSWINEKGNIKPENMYIKRENSTDNIISF